MVAVAVGGCGALRSERIRTLPPLGAPAAPSDPSFLLSGEETAVVRVRPCPDRFGEVSQQGSSEPLHPKCGDPRGGPQRPEGAQKQVGRKGRE